MPATHDSEFAINRAPSSLTLDPALCRISAAYGQLGRSASSAEVSVTSSKSHFLSHLNVHSQYWSYLFAPPRQTCESLCVWSVRVCVCMQIGCQQTIAPLFASPLSRNMLPLQRGTDYPTKEMFLLANTIVTSTPLFFAVPCTRLRGTIT